MKSAVFLLGAALSVTYAADPSKPATSAQPPLGELVKPKAPAPAVKNGDFNAAAEDGTPEHWKSAYPTGTIAVVKEGNESFLRVEVKGEEANAGAVQTIPVPKGCNAAVVRGRMRGKPGKAPGAAAHLVFWPKGGNVTIPPTIIRSEHSVAWKTESQTIALPPTVRTLEISARCVFATGRFDFDDIEVQFK
jgi:hypothetical protein